MKVLVDANGNTRDCNYHDLKQGYPIQEQLTEELYQMAVVPKGLCGIPELKMFQQALLGYQIKVLSIDPPHMMIYVFVAVKTSTPSAALTKKVSSVARRIK